MYKKILRQYLGMSFAFHFSHSFFFATYTLFLLAHEMSLLQMGIINAVFMISCFVLEIPTGALADTLGRKFSFVLSYVLYALSYFIFFFASSFWIFILAEIVGAFAMTFNSGAWDAWAVDSLNYHNDSKTDLHDIFRKSERLRQIGIIFGVIIGGYIGNISLALPWLVCAISISILAIYSAFAIKEEYFVKKEEITWWQSFKEVIQHSVKFGVKEKQIFWLIALSSVLFISFQAPNMYWNIFFQESFGIKPGQLGWIFAGISLSILVGNELSRYLIKQVKYSWLALLVSNTITVTGLILASRLISFWPILVFFLIHEMGRGSFTTIEKTYLQQRLPPAQRATIDSFKSMMNKGGAFIGLLVIGKIANDINIQFAWLISGAIIILSLPFYLKLKNGK